MRKSIAFFVTAALAAAPLTAQTPAARVPRTRAIGSPASDSARFAAIRGRFRRELDTERAALQRTRDRLREELTAAGWRPRIREGQMRMRMAGFRGRLRGRMMMRRRAMMGRRGPMMMGHRGPMMMGRGAAPMAGRRGPPMMREPGDSTRAMRRPPPRARPDSNYYKNQ